MGFRIHCGCVIMDSLSTLLGFYTVLIVVCKAKTLIHILCILSKVSRWNWSYGNASWKLIAGLASSLAEANVIGRIIQSNIMNGPGLRLWNAMTDSSTSEQEKY
jgi:hypothetical protein